MNGQSGDFAVREFGITCGRPPTLLATADSVIEQFRRYLLRYMSPGCRREISGSPMPLADAPFAVAQPSIIATAAVALAQRVSAIPFRPAYRLGARQWLPKK